MSLPPRISPFVVTIFLGALMLFAGISTSSAIPITVGDQGFETNAAVNNAGDWSNDLSPDWEERDGVANGNSFEEYIAGFAGAGTDHVGVNNNYYIWQDTGVAWTADTIYTLTVSAGHRSGQTGATNATTYALLNSTAGLSTGVFADAAAVVADPITLSSMMWDAAANVTVGGFADAPALIFATTATPPTGTIVILLGDASAGGRSHFDNIRLDAANANDSDADGLPDIWETANGLDPAIGTGDDGPMGDPDNDGSENLEEFNRNTNPQNPDTDSDMLQDGVEDGGGIWVSATMTGTDPLDNDTDDDLLLDGVETNDDNFVDATQTGTDPHLPDSDGDALPDEWEVINNIDPNDDGTVDPNAGAAGDPDMDDSPNSQELARTTDPQNADSDGDTINDGWEDGGGTFVSAMMTGTDPLDDDSDDDGFLDAEEDDSGTFGGAASPGTDPNLGDTDSDGFGDKEEVDGGTDPLNPNQFPVFPAPFSYWPFDDQEAVVTADVVGTNPATLNGAPVYITGHTGAAQDFAIQFDGVDDFVSPGVALLDSLNAFTMAGWVNFSAALPNRTGFFGQNDLLEFGMSTSANLQLWTSTAGATNVPLGPTSNGWRHIAVTGSAIDQRVYIDGVLVGTGPASTPTATSGFSFSIGGGGIFDDVGNFFTGGIDDVGLWDVALTTENIAGLASGALNPAPLTSADPVITGVAYDQGSGLVTLTWTSEPNAVYAVDQSADLQAWGLEIDDSIPSGGTTTTYSFNLFAPFPTEAFFRVRIPD